jgi:hypothetical protein
VVYSRRGAGIEHVLTFSTPGTAQLPMTRMRVKFYPYSIQIPSHQSSSKKRISSAEPITNDDTMEFDMYRIDVYICTYI